MKIIIRDIKFIFKDRLLMDESAIKYNANPMPFLSWFLKNKEIVTAKVKEDASEEEKKTAAGKKTQFWTENFAVIHKMIHPTLQALLVEGDLTKITHMEYIELLLPVIEAIVPKNE